MNYRGSGGFTGCQFLSSRQLARFGANHRLWRTQVIFDGKEIHPDLSL
jgi:hypothetical protein